MANQDWERWIPRGNARLHKILLSNGSNSTVWDLEGKPYIDFAGGIGVLNVGHCHPAVVEAIRRQSEQLLHTAAYVAGYRPYLEVCRRLCDWTPGKFEKKAVLFNSGAEAVENAIKIARSFTRKPGIIAFGGSFHGRTLLALTLTGKKQPYRQNFGPFPGEVRHAPYPYPYRPPAGVEPKDLTRHCIDAIERMLKTQTAPEETAAILVEPVLGEGGFVVPPEDFLPALRKLCDRHGLLLIADEIQTGFGRTGKRFAVEHSGVVPDLMLVAKSMAAGLPLSGVIGRADVMDSIDPGGLGGTYGGNPVSCAAAMAVFDVFEREALIERSQKLGKELARRFDSIRRKCRFVGDHRGLGPMRALELVRDPRTKEPFNSKEMQSVLDRLLERGVLMLKAGAHGNVLRCLVPLTVPWDDLDRGLDILETVLKQFRP